MDKKNDKNQYTTISLTKAEKARLDRFAKKYGFKPSEFIKLSLDYFISNAINPQDDERNLPKNEIKKIMKGIEEIKGFYRVFENQNLIPALERFSRISAERTDELNDVIYKNSNAINDNNIKLNNVIIEKLNQALGV